MDDPLSVLSMVMRVSHQCFAISFRQLDTLCIHPGQMPVLRLLNAQDGQLQKDLVRQLIVRPPTITVMLQRMERTGLIVRKPDTEDPRQYRIFLTAQGQAAISQAQAVSTALNAQMLQGISDAEQLLLLRLFRQMCKNLEQTE